jgi:hypothetical protein
MRSLIALILLALLAVNLYNFWQIQQLQTQVAALQTRVQKAETAPPMSDSLFSKTLPLLEQARAAIRKADFDKARATLAELSARAEQWKQVADKNASPALDWVRQQARSLENQIKAADR